ncbi:MAG TPA: hydroxysqualene dehydroxylase HpnE [Candidatus Limnocylindrales bacterium]|nr:hydroxysqualene dehydroxylase HpnE [Candidatus Limnocylindrales bacterium]
MLLQNVLVIGGGLAGLSSAVALAEAGLRVRLLEKRPHLGGRATSYTLPDGSEVDNCQHLTMGCCTNLADFFRRIGADKQIRTFDTLYLKDPQGRCSVIRGGPLPPPLHLAASLVFFRGLSLADKRGIGRALLAIARAGGEPPGLCGISMMEWLRRMNQSQAATERFWRAVLVSALDEDLSRMEARYAIEVFWKGFLASRGGYRISMPSVPLAQLYDGCLNSVERRGGEVRLRCGVREIRVRENCFACVVLEDGTEILADACILAVPQDVLSDLVPAAVTELSEVLEGARHIRTSPITSVHLWFDRPVMKEPYLALLERTSQWIFNKTYLYARSETNQDAQRPIQQRDDSPGRGGQYLQIVVSASYELVPRSRQEILDICTRELAEAVPATREAKLLKGTVIKEVNATFSPNPGVDRWRPAQRTPVKNLFLAGDWTRTGWPSTMESAVRSGYLAAEEVLADCGRPQKFLQPDLPVEGLSKVWSSRRAKKLRDSVSEGEDAPASGEIPGRVYSSK